jgi:hypothetical protein
MSLLPNRQNPAGPLAQVFFGNFGEPSVDNLMYIHRMRCAEPPFFMVEPVLSKIGSLEVHGFYSEFAAS